MNSVAGNFVLAEAMPEDFKPLYRLVRPPQPFPLDALGPLAGPAKAIQQLTQAPEALVAQSILAAATLATQAQRDVELPGAGRRPLTGIFITIAESGERKTSVDKLALKGVREMEAKWAADAAKRWAAYVNEKKAWDVVRKGIERKHGDDMSALVAALAMTGPEPAPPPYPMLVLEDFTPEALTLHLAGARPFAGVFSSEGGILIGGAAFNDDNSMKTGALLNLLWDGEPLRRSRIGTGQTYLPGRRCSVHIMLQQVVADKLFGDAVLEGNGLTARMLTVSPQSTIGTRFYRDGSPEGDAVLARFHAQIMYLLSRQVLIEPNTGALEPPLLRLSSAAKAAYIGFHDVCESEIRPEGSLSEIRGFGAKLAEQAGRLAAILTVYSDPDAQEICLDAMQCGITLATYYANEALRIRDASAVSSDLRLAADLIEWWKRTQPSQVHLATIYQHGPKKIRDAKAARRVLGVLMDNGQVQKLPAGTVVDGKPRKEAFELRQGGAV